MDFSTLVDLVSTFFTSCFSDLTTILLALVNWFFFGLVYVVAYPLVCLLDGCLSAVGLVISSIDLGSFVIDWAGTLSGLPGPMLYLMHACGFDTGLSMVSSAIVIRMLINLIPGALTRI
jgi:hypothetical protein